MPILLALPATTFLAVSRSTAFKSGILTFAISSTSAQVILPTLSVLGFEEPLVIFAFFLIRSDTGGVFITKSKVLLVYIVITIGTVCPFKSAVLALNCLQKS